MYEIIGTNEPAYLLAKAEGAETFAVNMEPGTGIVKRGTVIFKNTTGMWKAAAAADVTTAKQLAVLDETVDIAGAADGSKTIAEVARAFRSGCFVTGKVTLAEDAAVTAAAAVVLRMQGIVLSPMVSDDSFDNSK